MINTVCGEIDKKDLGKVLPHEHLLIDLDIFAIETPENKHVFHQKLNMKNLHHVLRDPYFIRDNAKMDSLEVAIEEVKLFKACGGNTIVDVTLDDIGRDSIKLKTISEKTRVSERRFFFSPNLRNLGMNLDDFFISSSPPYIQVRGQILSQTRSIPQLFYGVCLCAP